MKRFITILLSVLACMPAIYSQDTLSLRGYREKVMAYNEDIQIAQQTLAAATAFVKEVHTGFLPAVSGSGSYTYNFNPQSVSVGGVRNDLHASNWSAGVEIAQPLFTGGFLSATYNAAKLQQEIASLEKDLSQDNITYLSEITYWNTVASADYVTTSAQYLNILNDLYQVVKTRFDDGLISKIDLLKIETNLQEATYQESQARQGYLRNCILFNILIGEPVEKTFVLTDSLSKTEILASLPSLEEVLGQRPDYLAASKEIDWQKQQKKIDHSEFMPKVQIGAFADYGTPFINFSGDPLWNPAVYVRVSVPIFQWGKSKQSSNKNNALILSKELAKSIVEDNIRKNFSLAITNIVESEKQIEIALNTLKTAQESLDLHTFNYEEGQIPIIDVQSAQLSWLQASTRLIESYLNSRVAYSEYKKEVSAE